MNHLKHICGISVRASSNATLPSHCGQYAGVYLENRQIKSQQLRLNSLVATKKSHGVDVKYLGQFHQDSLRLVSKESKTICKIRSKTKSSVTSLRRKSSMHKKLPSKTIARRVCHYSTCQNVKFNSNVINKQSDALKNGVQNCNVNRYSSLIAFVEKHSRSYAEMIADYSKSLYKEGARNDSFHFDNAIRKSPFGTFSVLCPTKIIASVPEYSKLPIERQQNDFLLPVKTFDFCNRYNKSIKAMNKNINRSCVTANNLKSDDQSYAMLVADCSKSMHNISITNALNDGLASRRNVLARNSFESVITPTRKASGTQETSRKVTCTVNTMPLEKNVKEKVIELKGNDWLREMEDVMSDLKRATERKAARVVDVPETKESLDKMHGAELIKSSERQGKDVAVKKLSGQSDKTDRMKKRKNDLELQRHNYSHSSEKTEYFGSAAESSTVKKSSTHVSTSGSAGELKQPQVKLRMVPSEKESVVSINVDQASLNSASKHLSVVVQSEQKEDLQNSQWGALTSQRTAKSALQRGDFRPMHISISEDSAPVKQIEFSINGKPVSELKSITARTERLDVVSSVDKIEIRIPFNKDALNKTRDLSKDINSNTGPILNLQISANFQDESAINNDVGKQARTKRHQHDKDAIPKSSTPIFKTSHLSNNFPQAREKTLSGDNIQQYKSLDTDFKIQRKTTKDLSADNRQQTITDISLIKEIDKVKVKRLNMRRANNARFSEADQYNESSDNRVPSKMIPWWSSSNSFSKMKKKENDHKPLMPPSNQNEQNAVLPKASLDANKHSSSLNMKTSSGPVQKSEKLEISKVPSEESKHNRPKSLTGTKNTLKMTQELEKLKILTKSANPPKESSNTINKSPLQTIKQAQSPKNTNTDKIANKPLSSQTTTKIKDAVAKGLNDKNAEEMHQSTKTKRTEGKDIIARVVTQNPKSKDLLPKHGEENILDKSGSGKGHFLGSADPSRKPNNSAGTNTKSMTNDMSNSQSAIFKVRQKSNVVDKLEYPASHVIKNGSWINTDRPEKSILYSAWLQRPENDIKKIWKLF